MNSLCKKCLGCNRLEYSDLKLYKCDSFRSGEGAEVQRVTSVKHHQGTIRELRGKRG